MEAAPIAEPQQANRASTWVTVGIAVVLIAVGLAFALSATDAPSHWYAVFKMVHVGVAIFWIGGGLLLTVLAVRAERARDPEEITRIARQAALAGALL